MDAAVVRAQFRADCWLAGGSGLAFALMFAAGDIARIVLGASAWQVALIHNAPHFGLIFTLLVGAWLAGRRKRPWVIVPAAIAAVAMACVGLATTAGPFTALVVVAFAINGLSVPAKTSLYRRNYPPDARGQLVGRARLVMGAARLGVSVLAGVWVLYDPHAYRGLFAGVGLLALLSLWPYRHVPDAPDEAAGQPNGLGANLRTAVTLLGRDRQFARFMGLWFVFGLANLMTQPLMVLLLADLAAPLGEATASSHALWLRNVVPTALWFVTLLAWGRWIDTAGPVFVRGPVNLLWACCPAIWALWPVAVANGWVGTPGSAAAVAALSVGGLYVAQVFMGLAQGGGQLVWQLGVVPYARHPEEVPAYMSVHTTLTGIRGLAAPWLALGLMQLIGLATTILCCAVAMAVTGVITILWERDPHREGTVASARSPAHKGSAP